MNGHVIGPGADLRGADLSGLNLTFTRKATRAIRKGHRSWQNAAVNALGSPMSFVEPDDESILRAGPYSNPLSNFQKQLRGAKFRKDFTDKQLQIWHQKVVKARQAPVLVGLGADLQVADLRGADLRGADLRGANFAEANLSEANLCKADLSRLGQTPPEKVGPHDLRAFRGVDLRGVDLRGADLTGADLTGADLSLADVSGACLAEANLSCTIGRLIADSDTVWPAGFDPGTKRVIFDWLWCFRCDDPYQGHGQDPELSVCRCGSVLTDEPPMGRRVIDELEELCFGKGNFVYEEDDESGQDVWEKKVRTFDLVLGHLENCDWNVENCLALDRALHSAGIERRWNGMMGNEETYIEVLATDAPAVEAAIKQVAADCVRLEKDAPPPDQSSRKTTRPHIPLALRYKVMKRDQGKCQWCSRQAPDVEIHLDHIVPVSKGGETTLENLQLLCAEDNLAKSDRPDWKQ